MGSQPDIVLVMTDEQRFDWLGGSSGGFFDTPCLDALSAEGIVFANAYSSSTTCVPSRTSILTGLHDNRVPKAEGSLAIQEGMWTVARALRAAGYETAMFGRMHFTPMRADHGFDTMRMCENINPGSGYGPLDIDDYARWLTSEGMPDWRMWDLAPNGQTVKHLAGTPRVFPADAAHHSTGWIANEATAFLRTRERDRPLFMVVSFPHPHAPYDPPEPYASMYDPAEVEVPPDGFEVNDEIRERFGRSWSLYDGFALPKIRATDAEGDDLHRRILTCIRAMVRHIDDAVASVVAELDLARTTLFFTSDHGDYGGHRGLYTKVPWIPFEDILRVPLRVVGSAVGAAGATVHECVQTGSFTATCLDLAGIDPPDADGDFRSLVPFLSGQGDPSWSERPMVAALSSGYPTVRVGNCKFIGSWQPGETLLFDLDEDPGETRSFADDPAYADVLEQAAEAIRGELLKPAAGRCAGLSTVAT